LFMHPEMLPEAL